MIFLIFLGIVAIAFAFFIIKLIAGVFSGIGKSIDRSQGKMFQTAQLDEMKRQNDILASQLPTTADEFLKYKKLLDDGAITQEEFDAIKVKLLNK